MWIICWIKKTDTKQQVANSFNEHYVGVEAKLAVQ